MNDVKALTRQWDRLRRCEQPTFHYEMASYVRVIDGSETLRQRAEQALQAHSLRISDRFRSAMSKTHPPLMNSELDRRAFAWLMVGYARAVPGPGLWELSHVAEVVVGNSRDIAQMIRLTVDFLEPLHDFLLELAEGCSGEEQGVQHDTLPKDQTSSLQSKGEAAMTTAFISYTHDSEDHRSAVRALAQRLRQDGIDCTIDQFINGSPDEGWPLWMERQVENADYVLVVCSETYHRRYKGEDQPGRGLGGTWEAMLTRQDLYEGGVVNTKFLPVLLHGEGSDVVPKPLRPTTRYALMDDYDRLYRYMTGQPKVVPNPIGKKKVLPPDPT